MSILKRAAQRPVATPQCVAVSRKTPALERRLHVRLVQSRLRFLAAALFLSTPLAHFPTSTARGAIETWNPNGAGGGSGTWDAGITPDWDSGGVWTDGNDALFSGTGGTVTVINPVANSLTFSASGPYLLQSGTLSLTGNRVTVNSDATISSAITATSGLFVTGSSTLTLTGSANLGSNPNGLEVDGSLSIENGGTVSSAFGEIGPMGSVTVSGNGSAWTDGGDLIVGGSGSGIATLMISNGGTVSNNYTNGESLGGVVGFLPSSSVTATVTGAGSLWNDRWNLFVGYLGTGTLVISNGGTVITADDAFTGYLGGYGYGTTSVGKVLLSGSGSTFNTGGTLFIGESGTGGMAIANGATAFSGSGAVIGDQSTGIVTVSGPGSKWIDGGDMVIGNGGNGALAISGGGTVSDVNGWIDKDYALFGIVSVSGTGSTWINSGNLYLGETDDSAFPDPLALVISGGGRVSDESGYVDGGRPSSALLSGSGSTWNNSATLFVGEDYYAYGALAIADGGAVFSGSGGVIGDQAHSNGSVSVTGSGSTWIDGGNLLVSNSGKGTLVISAGGSVSDVTGYIGNDIGSLGRVLISGSGSMYSNSATLYIGEYGTGGMAIANGATVSSGSGGVVGDQAGSTGIVTVSGLGATWTDGGDLVVSNSGSGTLAISGGGRVTDANGWIGDGTGSDGLVTVSGTGSTWTNNGNLAIGESGTGALMISNGGEVTNTYGGQSVIGDLAGSRGYATVSGSGSTWFPGTIIAGNYGSGRLLISNGGAVSGPGVLYIGNQAGSTGVVTISGAGSKMNYVEAFYVGESGTGILTISNGGAITTIDNQVEIGDQAGSNGTVIVSGTGSQWTGLSLPQVGNYGTGTLSITDGGEVLFGDEMEIGAHVGSSGTVTVSGSGSTLTSPYGGGNLYVGISGAGTISPSSGGVGTLAISNGGTVSTYVGEIGNGTVTVSGAGSAWTGMDNLSVGISGTGRLTISAGGNVSDQVGFINSTVIVSGSGSTWTNSSNFDVGQSGTGTVLIMKGGTVYSGTGSSLDYNDGAGAGGVIGGETTQSSGKVIVSGSGSTWTDAGDLQFGVNGTLEINNGGSVSDENCSLMGFPVTPDLAWVSGSGSKWTNRGNLTIGLTPSILMVTDGGQVSVTGTTTILKYGSLQFDGGSQLDLGTLVIANGTLRTLSAATFTSSATVEYGVMYVDTYGFNSTFSGDFTGGGGFVKEGAGTLTLTGSSSLGTDLWINGSGAVQISGGGVFLDSSGVIGDGGVNGATISGSGSQWINTDALYVGYLSTGVLAINGGAIVSDSNGYAGFNAGSSGAITISGAGSRWTNTGNLEIGGSGSGTLAISGGGAVSDLSAYLGVSAGSNGGGTVSGTGSVWTNAKNLVVGYSGTGTLMVSSGGTVSDANGYVAYGAGSDGTVTVSGTGSKWTNSQALVIGDSETGALSITGGGQVSVAGATTIGSGGTLEFDGASTFNTGSLAINGGTVVTLGAATFASSATLGSGGVNIHSDGFNSTFSGNFSGAGGVAKSGSGAVTLTGASSYTGATAVNGGTLALTTGTAHTASLGNTAIGVASGATFAATLGASPFSSVVNAGTTGSGSAGATLTLDPGSTFSMAGTSLANFNLQQESGFSGPAFTIGGASGIAPTLIFDIGNAATGTDLLRVTGTVSVRATGGDIAIDALAGDTSLATGNYDLIVTGGGFSGVNGNGLALSGTTLVVSGTTYDLSLAHSTADDEILTVSGAPAGPGAAEGSLAGFDESGGAVVNAAPVGRAAMPLVGTAAVPEPGTNASLLLAFGIAAGSMLRRRRR